MTLVPDLLREQASKYPDRLALMLDGGGSLTYGAWDLASNRVGRALVSGGVRPGDRVGLFVTNQDAVEFVVAYLAVHKAGGVAVPLNPRLTDHEALAIVEHCGPVALICGRDLDVRARSLADRSSTLDLVLTETEVRRLGAEGDGSTFQVPRSADDLADILYTSGTTGDPKGVACSHGNVAYKGGSSMSAAFGGATYLHAVSLCTFAGTHAMTLIPLRAGMTNVVMPRFDAARFLVLLREQKVNVAYAVPSMVLLMLDDPEIARGDFPDLRLLMYGTAPMPPDAIRRLGTVFSQTMLLNLYGLTEGGASVCLLPPHEAQKRPDSLGRPMPPTEVRIVDASEAEVPVNEVGEIWLKSPVRPRHYFGDDDATAQTWTADGWVRTGDIGRVDADGYLYLVDRKKDLIIRGGYNVSAPEVEAALVAHPQVREAAVIGVPHKILGEDTRAVVVLRHGGGASADELEGFLRETLADYKVPRSYSFVPDLPRNALGKVLKRVLRAEARA